MWVKEGSDKRFGPMNKIDRDTSCIVQLHSVILGCVMADIFD